MKELENFAVDGIERGLFGFKSRNWTVELLEEGIRLFCWTTDEEVYMKGRELSGIEFPLFAEADAIFSTSLREVKLKFDDRDAFMKLQSYVLDRSPSAAKKEERKATIAVVFGGAIAVAVAIYLGVYGVKYVQGLGAGSLAVVVLLLFLDVLALVTVIFAALKWGRNFILGGLIGIGVELLRFGVVTVLLNIISTQQVDLIYILANMRAFNMLPIIVAVGVVSGGTASKSMDG